MLLLDLVAQLSFFSQHPALHSQPTEGGDKEEEEKEENKNLDIFASFVNALRDIYLGLGGKANFPNKYVCLDCFLILVKFARG